MNRSIAHLLIVFSIIGLLIGIGSGVQHQSGTDDTTPVQAVWLDGTEQDDPHAMSFHPDEPSSVRTATFTVAGDGEHHFNAFNAATTFLEFLQVPVSDPRREERGIVIRPAGEHRVRLEIYLGEHATPGHDIQIEEIVRRGDNINVAVTVSHPDPEDDTHLQESYPAAAAEFDVPPGDYTVNLHIIEQQTLPLTVK